MKYHKKGQMMGGVSAVIGLIVGMGVATLILIFVGVLGGKTYELVEDDINAIGLITRTTNKSFIPRNNTIVDLGYRDIQTGTLKVFNDSQEVINLNNFSVNYADGYIKLVQNDITTANLNGTLLKANFTSGSTAVRSSIKNSVVSGFEANEQTGELLPVIVLAFVITIVLTLVLSFTALGGGSNSGGNAL